MPVEIEKLVFRAKVELDRGAASHRDEAESHDLTRVVELCVEQVLEILRREKER